MHFPSQSQDVTDDWGRGGKHIDGLSKELHNERGEEKKEKETERERAKENGCGVEGQRGGGVGGKGIYDVYTSSVKANS